jgi:hypothetical protein
MGGVDLFDVWLVRILFLLSIEGAAGKEEVNGEAGEKF